MTWSGREVGLAMALRIMVGFVGYEWNTPIYVIIDAVADRTFGPIMWRPEEAVKMMRRIDEVGLDEAWKEYEEQINEYAPKDKSVRDKLEKSFPDRVKWMIQERD